MSWKRGSARSLDAPWSRKRVSQRDQWPHGWRFRRHFQSTIRYEVRSKFRRDVNQKTEARCSSVFCTLTAGDVAEYCRHELQDMLQCVLDTNCGKRSTHVARIRQSRVWQIVALKMGSTVKRVFTLPPSNVSFASE